MRPASGRVAITFLIAGLIAVSACGSDSPSSSGESAATDSSLAPEDIKVDGATVAAGLTQMPATIAAAIAAIGTPDAEAKLDAVEELWRSFEGTVCDKDPAIYLSIEDQLTPLQRQIAAGDVAAATATAATLSGLFTKYLVDHPA